VQRQGGTFADLAFLTYSANTWFNAIAVERSVNSRSLYLNGGSGITTGTVNVSVDVKSGSTLNVRPLNFNTQYGQNVSVAATIPENITMLDFLLSVIKSENLLIEPDPDDIDTFFIEPRNQFFDQGILDWTNKLDASKGISIKPSSMLDFKRYNLKFTQDSDKYSVDYFNKTGKTYGDYTYEVDNDFVKDNKDVQVIFSPSIMVGSYDTNIVAMRFFKDAGIGFVEPVGTNIRRSYWNQTVLCTPYAFSFNGTDYQSNSYPFAGSVDTPYSPTLDLNFGVPDLLYLNFYGNYTNNNRGNVQYLQMLEEITDRDSKQVTGFFKLTETDIYNFTFRKLIYFDGNYYYCNLIDEFNPDGEETTKVVLFKLKPSSAFSPTNFTLTGSGLGGGLGGGLNINVGSGISIGVGNFNSGGIIIGDNNIMGTGIDLTLGISPLP
jgi:hypothetical protein